MYGPIRLIPSRRGTHKYPEGGRFGMASSEITIMKAVENIALTDPISTVLFLVGGALTTVSVVVLGGLAMGAAGDALRLE